MMTIRDALSQGLEQLASFDRRTARLDAQVLLGHVLGMDRAMLYAYPERELSLEQALQYSVLLERRREHEPVAYLLGSQEFYSLDFLVDRRVLIPRPETELLVESALKVVREKIAEGVFPIVADIGTGSGAIAITLAVEEPRLPYLYACDISSDALAVARLNAQRHHMSERIHFLEGDLVFPLPEPVDLLLANLPYVGIDELRDIEIDVHAYEPHLALFSGPDGLVLLRKMCTMIKEFGTLKRGGIIFLEIGYRQREALAHVLHELWPDAIVTCIKDYAGWDRLVRVEL